MCIIHTQLLSKYKNVCKMEIKGKKDVFLFYLEGGGGLRNEKGNLFCILNLVGNVLLKFVSDTFTKDETKNISSTLFLLRKHSHCLIELRLFILINCFKILINKFFCRCNRLIWHFCTFML